MPLFLYVGWRVLRRIYQSARLIFALAVQRDRSRQLPWPYIKQRLRGDLVCVAAGISIVTSLVLYPIGAVVFQDPDGGVAGWWIGLVLITWTGSGLTMVLGRR